MPHKVRREKQQAPVQADVPQFGAASPASDLSTEPDLASYVTERVVLRTKDVRQAIQVAKLCDSQEEVDRFEGGKAGLRQTLVRRLRSGGRDRPAYTRPNQAARAPQWDAPTRQGALQLP